MWALWAGTNILKKKNKKKIIARRGLSKDVGIVGRHKWSAWECAPGHKPAMHLLLHNDYCILN